MAKVIWNTKPLISETERKLRKILTLMAIKVQNDAKHLCPVDTGNLRRSITKDVVSSTKALVGTNVEYAAHVEYGTKKSKGKPYLRPALDKLSQKDVDRAISLVK